MSVMPDEGQIVEVRLRYRPIGDILTVTIPSAPSPGHRHSESLTVNRILEWSERADGSRRLEALQVIDATHDIANGSLHDLGITDQLFDEIHALIRPGAHHHGHPSTHRPETPLTVHESTVRVPSSRLVLTPRQLPG